MPDGLGEKKIGGEGKTLQIKAAVYTEAWKMDQRIAGNSSKATTKDAI